MQVSLQRKNAQTCPKIKLYTYCFMNKQYVEGVQNRKKTSVANRTVRQTTKDS